MSVWNSLGSGAWSNAANWIGGVPDAIGATADFSNLANAAVTHHIDLAVLGPYTVGTLALTSSAIEKYSLENGMLIMSRASGAAINVTSTGAPLASVLASSLTLQLNSATLVTTTGTNTTLDNQAQITGVGVLTKAGTGTLKLSDATNNWSGGTHIAAGAIDVTSAAFGTGGISFTGNSSLRALANVTLANDIHIGSGVSATIKAATGTTLTLSGGFAALGGAGTVLHVGSAGDAGTVVFGSSGVGVVDTGSLSIDGGTLKAGAALGPFTDHLANTNIAAGATLDANGFELSLNHLTGAGKITNNGATGVVVNLDEAGTATFSGALADGAGRVEVKKIGAGTLTLSGANTYSGYTRVHAGTLKAGAADVFGIGNDVSMLAGTALDLNGFSQTIGQAIGEGGTSITSSAAGNVVLTIKSVNGSNSFQGIISDGAGTVGVTVTGGGGQSLWGANTYSGATVIGNSSKIYLTGAGSIASSSGLTILAGGRLYIGSIDGSTAFVRRLDNAGTVEFAGKTLELTIQSTNLSGTYEGSAGTDGLVVSVTSNFSLANAVFTNWTDSDDKISIIGNGLHNTLTGSSHADTMAGGVGNDTYYVANAGDVIVEGANQGTADWVVASVSYALGAGVQVEKLSSAAGTSAIDLAGNEFAQTIIGNAGANTIDGKADADTLIGDAGNDVLTGGAGADVLDGGAGTDTASYAGAVAGVVASLTDPATNTGDAAGDAYVSIENLKGTSFDDLLDGDTLANRLEGSAGDDKLDGKAGADTMVGGAGNDTYSVDNAGDVIVEGANQGTSDWVAASLSYALGAGVQVEKLSTTSAAGTSAINLTGNEFAQTITGNAGANKLDGKAGADTLFGNAGNDLLIGGAGADLLDGGAGTDTASYAGAVAGVVVSLTAPATNTGDAAGDKYVSVENVTGTSFDDFLNGDTLANRLEGGSGNDKLDGKAGADTMVGGIGNDTYSVDNAGDVIVEGANQGTSDWVAASVDYALAAGVQVEKLSTTSAAGTAAINLTGNEFAQTITGNAGANKLDGKAGADTMIGGAGNDTYSVDNAGDVIVEGANQGTSDWVMASINYALAVGVQVEKLSTTSAAGTAAINLTGNEFAQTITGNAGANKLDGKAGADTMVGGAGNDTYYVDNAGDVIVEGANQGTSDWVAASVNYALAAGVQVEKLSTTNAAGTLAINLTGNEFAQTITGNAGANKIDGKAGADTMIGGAGNDTYYVDNAGDVIVEGANQGTSDWVAASVSYALGAGVQVEKLSTTSTAGTSAIKLTGNEFAQTIIGNAGNNIISGRAGNDTLTGGAGHDVFVFNTALNAATNVDRITDFSVPNDTIQIDDLIFSKAGAPGVLASAAFYTGAAAHDASDRIVYNSTTGALFYDADGSGAGAAIHFATLGTKLALTNADFIIM